MIQPLTIEKCIKKVGSTGRYQIMVLCIYLLLFLITYFPYTGGTYLFLDPIFICKNGQECNQNDACKEVNNNYKLIQLDTIKSTNTFTRQFQLYCDRKTLKSVAQSSLFIGSFTGSLLFSYFMDILGRQVSQIICLSCMSLGLIILSFSVNVGMVITGYIFAGMGIYPSNQLSFIVLSEISIAKFRQISNGIILISFSIGIIIFTALSYAFDNDWKILIRYFITIPGVLLFFPNLFIKETPRFYLGKDNNKVQESLNYIAKFNKKNKLSYEEIDFDDYYQESTDQNSQNVIQDKKKRVNFWIIFKYKSIRTQVICAAIFKFFMMFALYGQIFALPDLELNIYTSNIFPSTIEIISFSLMGVFILKINRKVSLLILGSILNVCNISMIFFSIPKDCDGYSCWQRIAKLIVFCIGRGAQCQYFVMISMYFPELFPTKVRGLGLGFVRGIGVAGSIFSPYVVQFFEYINVNPLIFFGIVGFLNFINLIFLRETKGVSIVDKIPEEEKERLKQKDKYQQITDNENISKQENETQNSTMCLNNTKSYDYSN